VLDCSEYVLILEPASRSSGPMPKLAAEGVQADGRER
jgi:hypothetical protein